MKEGNQNAASTFHREASATVAAAPAQVFAHLDDQTRLAAHMSRPSLMMGGGRMSYEFDAARGQAVGSHIRMSGTAFGISLSLEEVVTERVPPRRKAWRTLGEPRLLVVGRYEMGFDLRPAADRTQLTAWIAYRLPQRGLGAGFLRSPIATR